MNKVLKRLLLAASLCCFVGTVNAAPMDVATAAYGRGDYAQAFKILRPLAEQGNAIAQSNIGVMYENGQGVIQSYKEAIKWYRLSAAQGNAGAQNDIGALYYKGRGVTQDYKEAVKWYRLSAAQGNAIAQYGLAFMYGRGQGVLQDFTLAHMWVNLASAGGSVQATAMRDKATKLMTPQQIEKAQDMARECEVRDFKGC